MKVVNIVDCEKCSGNGEITCYKCQSLIADFRKDVGTIEVCENCYDTGFVHCSYCFGNGTLD